MSDPKPASSSPDDRAQAFEAQTGAPIPEVQSGERLLVEAYVFIWIIAMVFVQLMWLRQRGIGRRLDALERAIDKHDPRRREAPDHENRDGGAP
jgi:hypothetical protein